LHDHELTWRSRIFFSSKAQKRVNLIFEPLFGSFLIDIISFSLPFFIKINFLPPQHKRTRTFFNLTHFMAWENEIDRKFMFWCFDLMAIYRFGDARQLLHTTVLVLPLILLWDCFYNEVEETAWMGLFVQFLCESVWELK
jgi:hypothetical protein